MLNLTIQYNYVRNIFRFKLMLHRLSKHGLICITQPHHAWLSGQLARVWGNEQFGQFVPKEEVYFAAEQHDIGWLGWEQKPTLNPKTGYP